MELKSITYTAPGAPDKPSKPSGPTSGAAGEEYTYSSSTTDAEGDQIYYWFEWGDGTNSGWLGPLDGGETASANHSWSEKGSYQVRVKAKDVNDAVSLWSDPLSISMPKNDCPTLLLQFLGRLVERFPLLKRVSHPYIGRILDFQR
jgi:hypothetical protein